MPDTPKSDDAFGPAAVSPLTLDRLRAVEAVARTGSFSAAAKALGLSQPSVSNRVQALEAAYGVRLLDRRAAKTEATPLLAEILPRLRSLLSLTSDLHATLDARRTMTVGRLRIGYSTHQVAIPLLSRFMSAYPSIALEARALASHDLLPLLEAGDLDAGFITAREIPAGLSGLRIVTTPIVLAVPKGHTLADQAPLPWAEVAQHPLIQREATSGTRRIFEAAARLARVEPRTLLALGSWGSIAAMVRAGSGLGVALEVEILPTDGLVPVYIDDPALTASHFVVCLQEMRQVAAIQRFLDLVDPSGNSYMSASTR